MPSFALVKDAKLSLPVTSCAWCPSMDVVCYASADGSLEAHRLNWQKLWHAERASTSNARFSALAFRDDGKILAFVDDSPSWRAIDVANGEEITNASVDARARADDALERAARGDRTNESHGFVVTSCAWVTHDDDETRARRRAMANGMTKAEMFARGATREREGTRRAESSSLAGEDEALHALVVCRGDGGVTMEFANGVVLARWRDVTKGEIECAYATSDLRRAFVVERVDGRASVLSCDLSHIATHAKDIRALSSHATRAREGMNGIESTIRDVGTTFERHWRAFATKMRTFEESLAMTSETMLLSVDEELRQRLAVACAVGTFDVALEHFFTTTFKIGQVRRCAKDLDVAFASAHESLTKTMSPMINAVMLRLGAILALARLGARARGIGLVEARVEEAIKACEQFAFCAMDAARLVTRRAAQLRAFFVVVIRALTVAEDGDAHGPSLPAPRLDLAQSFIDEVFGAREKDHLEVALGPKQRFAPSTSESLARCADHRMRALSVGESIDPLAVEVAFDALKTSVELALEMPCEVLSAECTWTRANPTHCQTSRSMFSNAERASSAELDTFHVDASGGSLHVYRTTTHASASTSVRVLTIDTPGEIIVDAAAYKNGRAALLLRPQDGNGDAKARLVLLDDGAIEGFHLGTVVDLQALPSRSRTLPCVAPHKPLAVSPNRGTAAVFVGATRVQLYDLEDDDDDDDEEDDEDDRM